MKKKNIRRVLCSLMTLLCISSLSAQKQGNWWFFGSKAGLDFNTLSPATATDGTIILDMPKAVQGPLDTYEGCFTISDGKGNLLFSSDGITVYNKNGIMMKNGNGLTGHSSATQSGIVVPRPEKAKEYYVITVGEGASAELAYSIVDMKKEGGLGEVTSKNNKLRSAVGGENICAVSATNGNYWLLYANGQKISVRPITSTGIAVAASFDIDFPHTGYGELFASNDCNKIVHAGYSNGPVTVAEFDNVTGTVSNVQSYTNIPTYGGCFSPNDEYVFIAGTGTGTVRCAKWSNLIAGLGGFTALVNSPNNTVNIQRASDNRLYGIVYSGDHSNPSRQLFVVEDPDNGLSATIKIFNNYLLAGTGSRSGLPNFMAGFDMDVSGAPFSCMGNSSNYNVEIALTGVAANDPVRLEWNWGDGSATETQNIFSTIQTKYSMSHSYAAQGKYKITITPYKPGNIALPAITLDANVANCQLQVNRQIRINVDNASTQLIKE